VRYRILILLVLLLAVSLYSVKTGWISSETLQYIYVTVATEQAGLTVDVLDPPSGLNYYCPGEVVNVSNTIVNSGSSNITGDLVSRILNPSSVEVHSQNWFGIDIPISEIEIYNTLYTIPADPVIGTYTAEGNFSYGQKFSYSSDTFEVSKGIGNFLVSTNKISVSISPGNYDTRNITFWLQDACDNTIVFLNTTIGIPGDWVTFNPNNILVTPFATNQTIVTITVPESFIIEGIYNGTIFAYANGQVRTIDLGVTVSGEAFNMTVAVPSYKKVVYTGDDIPAIVEISKNFPGIVDVNLTHQIRNFTGYVFREKNETQQMNDTLQTIPVLKAPSITGYFVFFTNLQYNSTSVSDSDTFSVIEHEAITPPERIGGGRVTPPKLKIYDITLRLSTNLLTVIKGNKTSFIAYVNNTGSETLDSIRLLIDGISMNWVEVLPLELSLVLGERKEFLVVIDVPEDAKAGIHRLNVKASNKVESNTETLTLVIARDPKEMADLLLSELERLRKLANESLSVEECIDITIIKSYYNDAELARERGLKEYNLENYVKAINWFEYAITVYEQVISRVDITVEMEISTTNSSRFIMPPIFDSDKQFLLANTYLVEKNYRRVCEPIEKLRKYIMFGLVLWPVAVIIPITLIIVFVILYKKKREKEVMTILERVRKRLGKPKSEQET